MIKYIRQVYYEMRHQKMMTWVSISCTALAVFLVMSYFMTDQLSTVEVAPESNRSRMMYGGGFEYRGPDMSASGAMKYQMIQKIFGSLDGIEQSAISSSWDDNVSGSVNGKISQTLDLKKTDGKFWRLYDFDFISGKPYEDADMETEAKKVIITRSVARYFFDKDDATGETLNLNSVPYTVAGVVRDIHPSLIATFANIYTPLSRNDIYDDSEYLTGGLMVHMLRTPGTTEESLKQQVEQRYIRLNQDLKKDSVEAIYHGAPHNAEYLASGIFGNWTPDLSGEKRGRIVAYCVLLLIPAINLGSMMRGRLRHRISEIGVRRAFGAKRRDIVAQLLGENLVVTLVGGAIGLALSLAFMTLLSTYFIKMGDAGPTALNFTSEAPPINMLFTWRSFAIALGGCFLLYLMSAFLRSWRASKGHPAEAISKTRI